MVKECHTALGKKMPMEEKPKSRKPEKISPDELPAAGMPSRKVKKSPDDKQPRKPDTSLVKGPTGSTTDFTVTEVSESSTNIRDSKTNIIRDSKTFVDSTNIVEHYTIIDGEKVPLRLEPTRTKDFPGDSRTVEYFESVVDSTDSKTNILRDSQTIVDSKNIIEQYTIVDGRRVPTGPGDRKPIEERPSDKSAPKKPSRKSPDELPAAGMPSRRDEWGKKIPVEKKSPTKRSESPAKKSPDELPAAGVPTRKDKTVPDERKPSERRESPSKKDKIRPEDLPTAGVPSRPDKPRDRTESPSGRKPTDKELVNYEGPDFPVTDSRTVIESFESVTNLSDSKTTVIKDSQTFVDNQSSVEHYTVTDSYDSAKPKGPKDRKPIEDTPGRRGPGEKPRKPLEDTPRRPRDELTTVENVETDVTTNVSESLVDKKSVVEEHFTTHVTDVRDTKVTDRSDKTFIREDIIDIKDINEVENITNIKRVSDNKVIKIEKVIREPERKQPHYKPPMKEQCICELCTCGKLIRKLEKVETYALVISAEGVMTTRFAKNIAALGLSFNVIRNGQKAILLQTCHI
ncbi:hypothetical protein NQ318_016384, partial [Aromia moschata]